MSIHKWIQSVKVTNEPCCQVLFFMFLFLIPQKVFSFGIWNALISFGAVVWFGFKTKRFSFFLAKLSICTEYTPSKLKQAIIWQQLVSICLWVSVWIPSWCPWGYVCLTNCIKNNSLLIAPSKKSCLRIVSAVMVDQ